MSLDFFFNWSQIFTLIGNCPQILVLSSSKSSSNDSLPFFRSGSPSLTFGRFSVPVSFTLSLYSRQHIPSDGTRTLMDTLIWAHRFVLSNSNISNDDDDDDHHHSNVKATNPRVYFVDFMNEWRPVSRWPSYRDHHHSHLIWLMKYHTRSTQLDHPIDHYTIINIVTSIFFSIVHFGLFCFIVRPFMLFNLRWLLRAHKHYEWVSRFTSKYTNIDHPRHNKCNNNNLTTKTTTNYCYWFFFLNLISMIQYFYMITNKFEQ